MENYDLIGLRHYNFITKELSVLVAFKGDQPVWEKIYDGKHTTNNATVHISLPVLRRKRRQKS